MSTDTPEHAMQPTCSQCRIPISETVAHEQCGMCAVCRAGSVVELAPSIAASQTLTVDMAAVAAAHEAKRARVARRTLDGLRRFTERLERGEQITCTQLLPDGTRRVTTLRARKP